MRILGFLARHMAITAGTAITVDQYYWNQLTLWQTH
jgi:hypothetical protein